jgi:general secretion pathway protein G
VRKHFTEDQNIIEKGFTLIELLIVVAILGILAAVVVFAVGGITGKSKVNACKIEVRTIRTAIEAAAANSPDNATYPTAAAGGAETGAATVTALTDTTGGRVNISQFLDTPLTTSSLSIEAGYRYLTSGQFVRDPGTPTAPVADASLDNCNS